MVDLQHNSKGRISQVLIAIACILLVSQSGVRIYVDLRSFSGRRSTLRTDEAAITLRNSTISEVFWERWSDAWIASKRWKWD